MNANLIASHRGLIAEMEHEDLKSAEREETVKRHGYPGSGHPGGES